MKQVSDILPEVISNLRVVKEVNSESWAHCPLGTHSDKTASFSINIENGLWHCFGCGQGGGLNDLTRRLNMDVDRVRTSPYKSMNEKSKVIRPYQRAKNIKEAADMLEDEYTETYRTERNKIVMDLNEGRITESKFYQRRQLLDHYFDHKMEIHGRLRERLTYEAKRGGENLASA